MRNFLKTGKEKNINNNYLYSICKGLIISIILTVASLYIYALILVNTNVSENSIKAVVIVISAISLLIGSSISSINIKKNGIINGILVGTFYFMTIYILSSIAFTGFVISLLSVLMILVGVILGGIGGIIGVNISR